MSRDASIDARAAQPATTLPSGCRVGAVVSTYHGDIGLQMLDSAREELRRCGLAEQDFLVVQVPGAFELPIVARALAVRDDVAAVLCFGVVIQGETSHDGYVAESAREGILRASLDTDKPILFGVLTCANEEQARARSQKSADGGRFDKGREVARAAVQTLAAIGLAGKVGLREANMGFAQPGPSPARRFGFSSSPPSSAPGRPTGNEPGRQPGERS